jgi:hypothetical protein
MSNYGPTQMRLLQRAVQGHFLVLDNAERLAALRLVRRGILAAYRFGNKKIGFTTVYKVVNRP